MRHFVHPFYATGGASELTSNGTIAFSTAGRFVEKTVQVVFGEAPNATVTLEGTCDDINWVQLADVTAASIISIPLAVTQLRVVITSYVGGTFSATFAGFDPRVGN